MPNGSMSGAAVPSEETAGEGCLAFCGQGWRAAEAWALGTGLGCSLSRVRDKFLLCWIVEVMIG